MQQLYLEDLKVGDTWTSREVVMTADSIKAFAKDYDPQPFHLDEDAAKDTFFQGLAASGWHTACTTMRLLVEMLPLADGLIGAEANLRWPAPTRAGDTLHVVAKITDIKPSRSKPDRAIVSWQIDTLNQNGDCAQSFGCKMLVFRRQQAE